MTALQLIEMAVAHQHISKAELARRLGWSPQLLSKRLKTAKFTVEEWEEIAKALGGEFKYGISFGDGDTIGL